MDVTQHALLALIAVPFLGFLFALMSRENPRGGTHNALTVAAFAVLANIALMWWIFTRFNTSKTGLQFVSRYNWIDIQEYFE